MEHLEAIEIIGRLWVNDVQKINKIKIKSLTSSIFYERMALFKAVRKRVTREPKKNTANERETERETEQKKEIPCETPVILQYFIIFLCSTHK